MSTPEDRLHSELLDYLSRIDARLGEICEDSPELGPEEVLAELEQMTAGTRDAVDRIVAGIEETQPTTADLNAIMAAAGRELAASAGFPLVVETTADDSLPPLRLPPDAVMAMVRRALQLSVEHVEHGGVVQLVTRTVDGHAELRVESKGPPANGASMPIGLRSVSLADILEGLGGNLGVAQDAGQLSLTLVFAVSAGIR